MLFLKTFLLIGATSVVAHAAFTYTSGYVQLSARGTRDFGPALPVGDDFLGQGTVVPHQMVQLSGLSDGVAPSPPASNLAGTFSLWDEPGPPLQIYASPGCCGLLLDIPTGGSLPVGGPVNGLAFSVLQFRLTGSLTVLRNGTPEAWGYEVGLANPTNGSFAVFADTDTTAVITGRALSLALVETFTSPVGGDAFQRPIRLILPDGSGQLQAVPEPGFASLTAISAAAFAVLSRRRKQ